MKKEFLTSGQLMEAVRKLDYKVQGMITIKDLNDIAENKIKNDAQKAIIRESRGQELLYTLSTQYIPSKIVTYV